MIFFLYKTINNGNMANRFIMMTTIEEKEK